MKDEDGKPLLGRVPWRVSRAFTRTVLFLSILFPLLYYLYTISPKYYKPAATPSPPQVSSFPNSPPVSPFPNYSPSTDLERIALQAKYFPEHGSKRARIRAPPQTVPPVSVNDGMFGFASSFPSPCADCLITWMQASIEFPDGTYANAHNGMWLHHILVMNKKFRSPVCTDAPDTFFGAGNERTVVDLTLGGTEKFGYYVAPDTTFSALVELMNLKEEEQQAVLTFTYEYIPGPVPSEFTKARVFSLNIRGCANPEAAGVLNEAFHIQSPSWTNELHSGRIMFMGGHLHDGGTQLQVFKNEAPICTMEAHYGQSPEFVSPPANGMMEMAHLSNITTCVNPGTLEVGDRMAITAYYDTSKHAPMVNSDGSIDVMGLAMFYLAEDKGQSTGVRPYHRRR